MRTRVYFAASAVAALALCALAGTSHAATVSIVTQDVTTLPADVVTLPNGPITNPTFFTAETTGSIPNVQQSPFGNSTSVFSAISNCTSCTPGNTSTASSVTFNYAAGITTWQILWGSPDAFNSAVFFSGLNGTGSVEGSFTGTNLVPPATPGSGFDFVTFSTLGTGSIGSVVLSDSGQAAFEYSSVTPTPIPAALPLLASALGLGFGATWWRRKSAKPVAALA
jgi:hypothetical protein